MWLFADESQESWWVGGIMAAVGIAYAVMKFVYWLRNKQQVFTEGVEKVRLEKQKQARREAVQEAWEVVDRLTKELETVNGRVAKLEQKHAEAVTKIEEREDAALQRAAKCEAEHAHTIGRLSIIEAWARQRGLKIPPHVNPGSSPHIPLPSADEGQ